MSKQVRFVWKESLILWSIRKRRRAKSDFGIKQVNAGISGIGRSDTQYTGSALEPAVEVVLDGDLLAQGTDYTVFYSDNVNAGKGSVKITGTGDYTGSANAEFTISPASISGAAISGVKSAHAVEEIFVPLLKKLTAGL